MADETIALTDEQAAQFGFAPTPAPVEKSAPVAAEATNVTPAAETKQETTPPATGKPAESSSPVMETSPTDGAKAPYKPEEVAEILKEEERTGKVLLDSSRLTPEGRLLQKSFQQGYGPKFEQAKRMREEAEKIKADAQRKLAEFEQARRDEENKRLYEKEVEEVGEAEAKRNLNERKREERIAQLEREAQEAKNRATAMEITSNFRKAAPNYHIPADDTFENIILSNIIANNAMQVWNGEPPKSIEESAAIVADTFGFTNVDNLWKIIRANPENEKAVKNFYIDSYIREKAKGPTVSPSTPANVQTTKPPVETGNKKADVLNSVLEKLGVKDLNEINLT